MNKGFAVLLATVLFAIAVFFAACSYELVVDAQPHDASPYMTEIATNGDHSYIPINLEANISDEYPLILNILALFELEHPNLEVVDWKLQYKDSANSSYSYIYGIWIDHRPKE